MHRFDADPDPDPGLTYGEMCAPAAQSFLIPLLPRLPATPPLCDREGGKAEGKGVS
jgi:hypothetical protein